MMGCAPVRSDANPTADAAQKQKERPDRFSLQRDTPETPGCFSHMVWRGHFAQGLQQIHVTANCQGNLSPHFGMMSPPVPGNSAPYSEMRPPFGTYLARVLSREL